MKPALHGAHMPAEKVFLTISSFQLHQNNCSSGFWKSPNLTRKRYTTFHSLKRFNKFPNCTASFQMVFSAPRIADVAGVAGVADTVQVARFAGVVISWVLRIARVARGVDVVDVSDDASVAGVAGACSFDSDICWPGPRRRKMSCSSRDARTKQKRGFYPYVIPASFHFPFSFPFDSPLLGTIISPNKLIRLWIHFCLA